MDKVTGKLTVFFEGPFWVGVFERAEEGRLSVCRVVFGARPSDAEVWAFVLKNYGRLEFSPAVGAEADKEAANPKRRQREAQKQVRQAGVGTKSQQALQLQREQAKARCKAQEKERKAREEERRFALKQQKRRDKHRGR